MNTKYQSFATAVALAGACFAVPAVAGELKLAHFASTKYHLHNQMFLPLAEKMKAATNGATTIRVYPGGELGKGPAKQYDRVVDGVADIVYGLPGYTAGQFKKTLLLELPGIVGKEVNKTDLAWKNINHVKREFRRAKLLGLWTTAEASLLMAKKKVSSMADLKGLKIRVPSRNSGRVVEAWGATAVSMPITQVYTSMQTGVVDGTLVDTSVLKSFKLGEVTKYVVRGMNATNSMFMLVMNRDSYNALDKDTQSKLEGMIGAQLSESGRVIMTTASEKALAAWVKGGGEIVDLPAQAAAEFNAKTDALAEQVITELDGKGVDASSFAAALKQ